LLDIFQKKWLDISSNHFIGLEAQFFEKNNDSSFIREAAREC
jgi:septation ring formation regulator EzrA